MSNNNNNKRVRLKDIAEVTGLTVNSVSRALRDADNISDATKERVRRVAKELGYIPNQQAQALRNVRIKVIAVVYDNIINPYYSAVTGNIDSLLSKRGYRPMVFFDHNKEGTLSVDTAREIISFGLSGVISFLTPSPEVVELFEMHGVPLVILGRNANDLGVDSVLANDYRGGKLAGYRLVDTGGKNFVYFGVEEAISINKNRLTGYQKALHNNEADIKHIIFNDHQRPVQDILEELLAKDPHIDSIFCFNDLIAFEVIDYLMKKDIKVPEQISVVGFDNLQHEVNYPLRLSTIDNGKEETAQIAIELLFEKMQNPELNEIVCRIVDVTFIEGVTTKPLLRI